MLHNATRCFTLLMQLRRISTSIYAFTRDIFFSPERIFLLTSANTRRIDKSSKRNDALNDERDFIIMPDETIAAPAEPKWTPEVRNGQAERRPGTVGRASWDICDAITARNGTPASCAEALAEGTTAGINSGQMRASYAHWRKFNGLQGVRVINPEKQAVAAQKLADKIADKQAKADAKAEAAILKGAQEELKALEKQAKAEQKAAEKQAAAEAAAAAVAVEAPPAPEA